MTRLRRADPDGLSRPLVEREIAVAGAIEIAPREDQGVQDDLVALDDRRRRAAAVRGHRPVLVGQRSIPENLAVRRHADQLRRHGEDVDVAGFGIHRGRRPRRPVLRHVAQVQAEAPLPHDLAGFRVERHQALLRVGDVARRRVEIEAIAERHRRRPAADRDAPGQVVARRRPFRRQVGLGRMAVPERAAPLGPVRSAGHGHGSGDNRRHQAGAAQDLL